MTKSAHWLGAGALACFAALSACGSKGNGGGSGSGNSGNDAIYAACLGPSFSSACDSCLQASCGSAVGAFASECNDYIQCYCPNGAYNGSAQQSQACLSKATASPSCLSSVQGMNSCVTGTCASACQSSSQSSGSSGGGGTGSGGGASGGSGGSVAACGVAFTTGACASCVMAKCCSVTQACAGDQGCLDIINCIHGCKGDMKCEQSCVSAAPNSAQMELNAAGGCWTSSCSNSGC